MLQSLSFQAGEQALVARKDLIVLDIVHQAQGCIEGLKLQGSLLDAGPLPSGMDPFCIQDMVRAKRKRGAKNLKRLSYFPWPFHRRTGGFALEKSSRFCHSCSWDKK